MRKGRQGQNAHFLFYLQVNSQTEILASKEQDGNGVGNVRLE